MKEIISILTKYCNNHGSYIRLAKLKELWMSDHLADECIFHKRMLALLCAKSIRMEFDRVYLERVWRQENYAAERLHAIRRLPSLEHDELPDVLCVGDLTLSVEQRDAVASCLKNPLSLLMAPAGSGKTTIAQAILQYSKAQNPLLCSPTGKAAKLLGTRTSRTSGTIHRMLGIKKADDFLELEAMDDVDLILVDEAGMLTIDMLSGLLRIAPEGCRIVLLGDRNQLQAIGPGDVVNDLIALGFPCNHLTANHRIAEGANALVNNVVHFDDIYLPWQLAEDNSFQRRFSDDDSRLLDMVAAEAVNRCRRGESVQTLTLRNVDVLELNRRIQRRINPAFGKNTLATKAFHYVDGDRVIIIENDYLQGCFNGESGRLHIEDDGSYFVELEDGRCPGWSELEAPTKILPAYAITVHRSQGSEYDTVLLYVPRCNRCILHRNSLYTGISRAKKKLILFADPAAVGFALSTPPLKRDSSLIERFRAQELLLVG